MDNAQAAAVLRRMCLAADWSNDAVACDACALGADSLEFKAWLLEKPEGMLIWPRCRELYQEFLDKEGSDFLAYCEAKFEEHRKGLTK